MPKSRTQLLVSGCLLAMTCVAVAQESKGSATKSQAPTPLQEAAAAGDTESQVYRNTWFGFSCRIPFGWVDRTDEMREASNDPKKAMVLLGVFERPPMAPGSTVNSSIVIAAESAAAYPGLKSAAQYFGPLDEIMEKQGVTKANDPYEFPVDGKPIVREDFGKKIGDVGMQQSTLVWLTQGYVVSFTFIGTYLDELQMMIEGLKIDYSHKPKAKSKGPQS
ncbi:MAG TPA: hypothetical protein VMB18_05600 [Terriglobales bacterium]|nr:hypothetical protein [Terriglobales bacterium]